jgi:hypothetical protein
MAQTSSIVFLMSARREALKCSKAAMESAASHSTGKEQRCFSASTVSANNALKLLPPTSGMALLALKAPPELDQGGRVGPCQEDWARKDGGVNQCNDEVGCVGMPSGVGR